jgi:hypothetical protein
MSERKSTVSKVQDKCVGLHQLTRYVLTRPGSSKLRRRISVKPANSQTMPSVPEPIFTHSKYIANFVSTSVPITVTDASRVSLISSPTVRYGGLSRRS